jgi:hypothetical protein
MIKTAIKRVLSQNGWELNRIRPPPPPKSETAKCRSRLAPYCVGYGIDVGSGGDAITQSAIRVDLPTPYSNVGPLPVQLGGAAENLKWFVDNSVDNSLDYVYSSHLLQDFYPIDPILIEWLRVIRSGGRLILFCPDQKAYEANHRLINYPPNPHHKDPNFNIETVKSALERIGMTRIIHQLPLVDEYSWE